LLGLAELPPLFSLPDRILPIRRFVEIVTRRIFLKISRFSCRISRQVDSGRSECGRGPKGKSHEDLDLGDKVLGLGGGNGDDIKRLGSSSGWWRRNHWQHYCCNTWGRGYPGRTGLQWRDYLEFLWHQQSRPQGMQSEALQISDWNVVGQYGEADERHERRPDSAVLPQGPE
jgi:hypothetical protein